MLSFFLGALAFVCCYPIIFLLTGALMGQGEAAENLRVIFAGGGGFASWSWIPFQPTLRSYVELIFDTPDFFVMFWNSMKITVAVLLGQLCYLVFRRHGDLPGTGSGFTEGCSFYISL